LTKGRAGRGHGTRGRQSARGAVVTRCLLALTRPRAFRGLRGTRPDRADLVDEIAESFAYLISIGPDYSRAVTEHVQHAVRSFHEGNGNQDEAAIQRGRDAASAVNDRPAL
jgi:hypothetical protein